MRGLIPAVVLAAMLAGILHRASHAPWRCDDQCPWWGWD